MIWRILLLALDPGKISFVGLYVLNFRLENIKIIILRMHSLGVYLKKLAYEC